MLNRIQLIGNLGKDPEVRFIKDETAVCNFSLATTEKYKNRAGEKVTKTEWHNIVVWRKLAEICGEYLRKGSLIYIEGAIQTRSWDKDGVTQYTTEIVAKDMKMLGSSGASGTGNAKSSTSSQASSPDEPSPDDDDDVPF